MDISLRTLPFQLGTILIAFATIFCAFTYADLEVAPVAPRFEVTEQSQSREEHKDGASLPLTPPSQSKLNGFETVLQIPEDPCLQNEYRDWREFSLAEHQNPSVETDGKIRLLINRANYLLTLEVVDRGRSTRDLYHTTVGLGDLDSPTPAGSFVINHIYCYPDVVFFHSSSEKVSELYKGFFAPLLLCDTNVGRCARYNDLGIHGFCSSAHPNPSSIRPETYGAVSGGCIRLPDPCSFKRELIRSVGVGPVRKNERGSYHWLKKPVEVIIEGGYPGADSVTIADAVQHGLTHIRAGLESILELLGR